MASITLEELRKEFGDVVAVEGTSLKIPDGSFAALLGPSGCGKTTTLNMISGFERPTSGRILFGDRVINDVAPGKRDIGFVFQSYALFTHMSVYENLAFGLKVHGRPAAEIRREVDKVAALLQIERMLPLNAGRLSVNDMQKVALGRSMITNPSIFLLDEPFSNLDAAFRAYMRGELKRLQREMGQTMIYVTHDQIEAMSMADYIAVMDVGVLQQFGTPEEIYNQPVNTFVARFIGSPNMNFLDCVYREENGDGYLMQKDGPARLRLGDRRRQLLESRPHNDDLILGVRPEHLEAGPAEEAWPGVIHFVEPLGPKTIVHTEIGDTVVQSIAPGMVRLETGVEHYLRPHRDYIHVFDATTGDVIR